jgi:CMP-N,N'-diacetyllegionaminic acid synthase
MTRSSRFTAIVPVRGGSKGIPGKNLWSHEGISLLARAIRLGHHLKPWVERVIVSTDSSEMQEIARMEGAECPELRPSELATDRATSVQVVQHEIKARVITSDHILLLQATSPLRTLKDGQDFIAHYLQSGMDAATSVVRFEEPRPEKLKRFDGDKLRPYLATGFEGPRQSLPSAYALNGAFYAVGREAFLREASFLPKATTGFVMPPERSHNLDAKQDILVLSAMLAAGHWHLETLSPVLVA